MNPKNIPPNNLIIVSWVMSYVLQTLLDFFTLGNFFTILDDLPGHFTVHIKKKNTFLPNKVFKKEIFNKKKGWKLVFTEIQNLLHNYTVSQFYLMILFYFEDFNPLTSRILEQTKITKLTQHSSVSNLQSQVDLRIIAQGKEACPPKGSHKTQK